MNSRLYDRFSDNDEIGDISKLSFDVFGKKIRFVDIEHIWRFFVSLCGSTR